MPDISAIERIGGLVAAISGGIPLGVQSRWLWTSWVVAASIMHATWGILLIGYASAAMATPVASIAMIFRGHIAEGVFLIVASIAAGVGLRLDRRGPSILGMAACLPQQALLMMSCGGSSVAIATAQYADGTPSTSAHILADQLPILLMVAGHTFGLILFHGQALFPRRRAWMPPSAQ